MPTTVDTSIYPTQPAAQPNLLGMASQFATTQNALNQNQLFQQTFAARKALGGIMQQSIGPDGNIDYNKASVLLSTNPDAAFMAPDIINGWVQRENLQADTVLKNLQAAKEKTSSLGDIAAALVEQGQAGQSYKDAQGNPVSNAVDQKDIIGATSLAAALHKFTPQDQMSFLTKVGINPQTGKYDPKLGFQHLQQFALQQQGATKTLDDTYGALSTKFTGGTQLGVQNKVGGTYQPLSGTNQPQGVIPETAGPGVPGVNTVTGAKTQTLQGQPLPAAAGTSPAAPQRPQVALPGQGSGPETTMAGNPAAPAGINVGSGATPVPTTTTQLGPVQQKRLEAMPAYIKEANDQATKSLQMNQILDEMDKARSTFKTGGGMGGFVELAKGLQAAGVKTPVVDSVAGGNLGSAQEYGKLQAQLAAAVLKNALMPGAGRILQSEYETFNKANANWDTDPRAIDKMFQFMRKQNQINITRSTALNSISQAANAGKPLPKGMSDLSDFEPWFNGKLVQSGMISGGTAKALRGQEGSDPANITAPRAP